MMCGGYPRTSHEQECRNGDHTDLWVELALSAGSALLVTLKQLVEKNV